MALPTQSFQDFVNNFLASWSSSLSIDPVLSSGDPLLALAQMNACEGLFLQSLIQIVNNLTRAATSTGADLDTWMADFNFVRLPATFAEGEVTFSVATANSTTSYINVGTLVQTSDGTIQYAVIADSTQPTFNSTLNQYVLNAGNTSLTASVQALQAGTAFNVQAGQLNTIGSAISGISFVTNATAIQDGVDTESDANFRTRFIFYINSLSKATYDAIVSVILNYQQGLKYNVVENATFGGGTQLGYFFTVVDNGSFNPPSSLLTALQTQINQVRAFTVQQNVYAPTIVNVTVVLNIRVATGYTLSGLQSTVQNAIIDYVDALPIGNTVFANDLVYAAINSSPGVISVQPGLTINSSTSDLVLTNVEEARAITVTVGSY